MPDGVGQGHTMIRKSDRPCAIHRDHSPNPQVTHLHHTVPKAWGGEALGVVPLCPTSHANVHVLLGLYVKTGGRPSKAIDLRTFGYRERELAKRGWDGRTKTRRLSEPSAEED